MGENFTLKQFPNIEGFAYGVSPTSAAENVIQNGMLVHQDIQNVSRSPLKLQDHTTEIITGRDYFTSANPQEIPISQPKTNHC